MWIIELLKSVCVVPFEEDDKDPSVWFLDHNYVEAMNDMFKKVNGMSSQTHMDHVGSYFIFLDSKGEVDWLVS